MKKIILIAFTALLSTHFCDEATAQCSGTYRNQPVYSQPVYSQPVYSQPVYSPPIYEQPVYGQPAVGQPVATKPAVPAGMAAARQHTQAAKAKFLAADYAGAKDQLDRVVKLAPKDTAAFQFRALTEFAQGNFKLAAADIYEALKVGNTWTKPVVDSLYGSQSAQYSTHLAVLQAAAEKADAPMQVHFLMAYHSLVREDWPAAQRHLQEVLERMPAEPMATKLLAVVDKKITS